MKNYSLIGVLSMIVFLISGCTSEELPTEDNAVYDFSAKKDPSFLRAPTTVFGGPVFDLAAAPNNDILVADAGFGITSIYGTTEVELPGVSSIASIGTGSMWATTGSLTIPTEDGGQGLHRVSRGKTEKVANLFAFEAENNPDGQAVDSNPYSVAALNAHSALVADAGANDLLRIDNKGNIEVVAIFPNEMVSTQNIKDLLGCPIPDGPCDLPDMIPAQPVPTTVIIGPDGYYYVGELKGFPAPTGESNIWKISPDASGAMCGSSTDCVKLFDGGFTSIIDMTFDEDGMLYVAELDEQSWFAVEVLGTGAGGTIKVCNPETLQCEVVASGIPILTAITFDKDGRLWATKNSLIPGQAEVIEISL